jgi:gamma-D-glutamyl-L-lysine dipeptidyl-peptidase
MKTPGYIYHISKTVIVFGILSFMVCCQNPVQKKIQSQIDSISFRYVPDNRIAICRIIAKPGEKGTLILSGETTDSKAKGEIIKTLNNQGIKFIDSVLFLPDTVNNKKYMGLVTLSVVNLRKHPDHASEMVSQARLGTPVLILKNDDSWLLIQTPDSYIAWTEKSSIVAMTSPEMAEWRKSRRVIYLDNSGWIYSAPDRSGIVGDLVAGNIVEQTGESGSYIQVLLPDRRTGFVEKKALTEFNSFRTKTIPDKDGVINRAESLLGVPYLWGGTSSKGVDCSGFVQTVYSMNGIILQRDASLQALHGYPVDISKDFSLLRPGDLLFFGSKKNSSSRVTHVAIYMGAKKYINSSGRVMINSLDSTETNFNKYRLFSLLSARRIIGVENDPGIVTLKNHIWY